MKEFFRYLLLSLVMSKKLSEAVNRASTPSELDLIVFHGGDKNEEI